MAAAVAVDALEAGEHACLTFTDDDERLDIIAAFVADGITGGQRVVCYTDATSPRQLRDDLAGRDVPVAAARAAGALRVHTVEDRWLGDGGFRPDVLLKVLSAQVADALAAGFSGLRVASDMSWAIRPLPGVEQLGAYESAVNALFADGRLTSICQYDRVRFDAVTLAVVADAHPHAVAATTYHDDPLLRICRQYRPRGVRVAGEIDFRSVDTLRAALSEAIRLDHDLHLNLTRLRFIDAAAGGEIVNTAAGLSPDRSVIVRCTPWIAKILTVLNPKHINPLRIVVVDDRR